ncbi:hypothetical protein GW17_00019079 [Ensete ventricosum]|nr:hypothetical protein GW17_00019079 [Ensete ventricosum]RZR86916.1 hypothetical protein BHM03_00014195 [Ensete ventricosum]
MSGSSIFSLVCSFINNTPSGTDLPAFAAILEEPQRPTPPPARVPPSSANLSRGTIHVLLSSARFNQEETKLKSETARRYHNGREKKRKREGGRESGPEEVVGLWNGHWVGLTITLFSTNLRMPTLPRCAGLRYTFSLTSLIIQKQKHEGESMMAFASSAVAGKCNPHRAAWIIPAGGSKRVTRLLRLTKTLSRCRRVRGRLPPPKRGKKEKRKQQLRRTLRSAAHRRPQNACTGAPATCLSWSQATRRWSRRQALPGFQINNQRRQRLQREKVDMADEGTPPQRPVEIDERLEMALLAGYPREQHRDALHFPLLFSLRPPPVESPSFAPHHSNVRGPTLSRTPNLSNPVDREEEPQFRARTRTEDKRREPRKENKSASFRFRSCDGKPSIIYLDSIDTIFRGAIGDGDPGKETLYTYRVPKQATGNSTRGTNQCRPTKAGRRAHEIK